MSSLKNGYSRRFRIVAATIMWISGVLNFGIFPAVGANFFMSFCGFPETFMVYGINIQTFPFLMVVLLLISLYFTFSGGQITVLATDFLQSFFSNIVLVVILCFLLYKFSMKDVFDGISIAEAGKSMINPLDMEKADFNPYYFVIGIFGLICNRMAWQGAQGYQTSAKSPHEAKMAGILGGYRTWAFTYSLILIPLIAYMIMHHPKFASQAAEVYDKLQLIDNEEVRDQMLVPVTMSNYLPVGMFGAFAAVMFAAFVSTHDTYLHSWGSVFIQDIVMPFRGKSFTPKAHLILLRLSICGVAVFIFFFSYFFRQTTHILYYFALTGAIWLGGAGVVIIGGLYSRWGTTAAAYTALIAGSLTATGGMVCEQKWNSWFGIDFYFTGQEIYFFAMILAWVLYALVSFLGPRATFNLDKLLHRGKYRISSDHSLAFSSTGKKRDFKTMMGLSPDFSKFDKFIFIVTVIKSMSMFLLFMGMVVLTSIYSLSDSDWRDVQFWSLMFYIVSSFFVAVWLLGGGLRDFFRMFRDLRNAIRDDSDDGFVKQE